MGFDVYCALCGAPFRELWDWADDDEDECTYNTEVLANPQVPELQWMRDSRIIGENLDADTPCKIWVSGPAHEDYDGMMQFESGDDHEVQPNLTEIRVYAGEYDDCPFSIPFHVSCREVFCRYLGTTVSQLDKKVFFEALKSLGVYSYHNSRLNIEYGVIEEELGQHFSTTRDTEWLVFNPFEDQNLNQFLKDLPTAEGEGSTAPAVYNTSGDPFAKLSPDVLFLILSELRQPTAIFQLRRASPQFSNLQLSHGFWRNLMKTDMPWLWELPDPSSLEAANKDWKSIYKTIARAVYPPFLSKHKFRGLCNRMRIWDQIIPQIAPAYWDSGLRSRLAGKLEVESGSSGHCTKRIGISGSGESGETIDFLLNSLADLASTSPSLFLDWTDEGRLLGIRALAEGATADNVPPYTAARTDKVEIPAFAWLTGLVFISRGSEEAPASTTRDVVGIQVLFTSGEPALVGSEDGDKHFILVKKGYFAIALKSIHNGDNFHQFSIIQQDLSKAEGCQRLVDQTRDPYNAAAESYLWHGELPPPSLRVSKIFGMQENLDIIPMKSFIFASSPEEIADITGISVDIQLGGFQVTYGSQPSRSFGPRLNAMKTLKIDGKEGERIDRVTVTPRQADGMPVVLRITTSRNRSLIVGESIHTGTVVEIWNSSNSRKLRPCGFTASWSGSEPCQWLRNFGILAAEALGNIRGILPVEVDKNRFCWEPTKLPQELKESGPIMGTRAIYDDFASSSKQIGHKPSAGCTVSWLDFKRSLAEVRVTLVHSTHVSQVPISAISLTYSDGEVVTVGPDKFSVEPKCGWCKMGQSFPEELRTFPHYRHQVWQVGGKKLTSLRIWVNESQGITALQFIAEGEEESPVWGVWEHDLVEIEPIVIYFAGYQGGEVAGLKFFFQHNERVMMLNENVQNDTIVYAIQALIPA